MTGLRDEYWRAVVVYRIVDGDTVYVQLDLGHRYRADADVRLLGVNTPELHASDPAVRARAEAAKQYTTNWLYDHAMHNTITLTWGGREVHPFNMRSAKSDDFGRWLGWITCQQDHSLSQDLIDSGNGVPYP